VAVPPDEYLPMVEDICRRYDVLLQVDEVINGFGRTGKMFGHQHWGISPDIMAVAKGIVSAYLPIGATFVKNKVFDSFLGEPAEGRQVFQVNTYGGHPVAAAVAMRNVEILLEEQLADRAASMGGYLKDRLNEVLMKHAIVGDIRGRGLLLGVELVEDRESRRQLAGPLVQSVVDHCKALGVIVGRSGGGVRHSNTIVLSPPLIITRTECDTLVEALDHAIGRAAATLAGTV
jgi:adenosylmethionine-8-amino-7-oxononanoate aminotransferase